MPTVVVLQPAVANAGPRPVLALVEPVARPDCQDPAAGSRQNSTEGEIMGMHQRVDWRGVEVV